MSHGSPAPVQWRRMIGSDIVAVSDLAIRLHPDFPERPQVLSEKLRLFPRGCFVLENAADGGICGYCLSHPWTIGLPPALDSLLGELPRTPSTYFIHDLAVEALLRRRNLAAALVLRLVDIARAVQVERMMLVAVSGSEPFWERMGFRRTADDTLQAAVRVKYGAGSVQMERDLV